MKTMLLLALVAALAAFLTGCSTARNAAAPAALIQQALDAALPPNFSGPAKFTHTNQFFDLVIEAEGLHRTDKGWEWTWLTYERRSHFPAWSSAGQITLGKRP